MQSGPLEIGHYVARRAKVIEDHLPCKYAAIVASRLAAAQASAVLGSGCVVRLLSVCGRPRRRRECAGWGWPGSATGAAAPRSEEHTSELQSRPHLVCRLLLEKKK